MQGGELFDYVSNNGPLPEEEAVRFFRQIIAGLGYCHQFNISHRDLKLENILLDACRSVKLADFGLAALQPAGRWFTTAYGSPNYAAPELIHQRKYRGDKADIWSCGIIQLPNRLSGTTVVPQHRREMLPLFKLALC
jgi:serine/threonine protein kinase